MRQLSRQNRKQRSPIETKFQLQITEELIQCIICLLPYLNQKSLYLRQLFVFKQTLFVF